MSCEDHNTALSPHFKLGGSGFFHKFQVIIVPSAAAEIPPRHMSYQQQPRARKILRKVQQSLTFLGDS